VLPDDEEVGASTSDNTLSARSGRPPRDTVAWTSLGRRTAANSAAAAPVLAPNRPIGSAPVAGEVVANGASLRTARDRGGNPDAASVEPCWSPLGRALPYDYH